MDTIDNLASMADEGMPDLDASPWKVGDKRFITKDGGVEKELLVEGTGDEYPQVGDDVSVHYVGTLLDGTKFDSSRDRGDYFKFGLGVGQVIKGWDEGVATMRKGEKCLLTCKPEYAYGARGSPPTIPPAATLQFEVELFSWRSKANDVLGDGSIDKKVINKGSGTETPGDGAKCVAMWIAKLEDGTLVDITQEPQQFTIGDEEILPGLEKAVEKMKAGEKAQVTIAPEHAHGAQDTVISTSNHLLPNAITIPAYSTVVYEVELLSFENEPDTFSMAPDAKLAYAEAKKGEGNALFKTAGTTPRLLQRAMKRYSTAIGVLEEVDLTDWTPEQEKAADAVRGAAHANAAAVCLKMGDFEAVEMHCGAVLENDPDNVKALFRLAQADAALKNYAAALAGLKKVVELDPRNRDARALFKATKDKQKSESAKEKAMYSKMFGGSSADEQEHHGHAHDGVPCNKDHGHGHGHGTKNEEHGHSHGGKACTEDHGHGHGAKEEHGHGHGDKHEEHGHSHGGKACTEDHGHGHGH